MFTYHFNLPDGTSMKETFKNPISKDDYVILRQDEYRVTTIIHEINITAIFVAYPPV